MSTDAIVMMILAILLVWGGLALALVNLSHSRTDPDDTPNPDSIRRDL